MSEEKVVQTEFRGNRFIPKALEMECDENEHYERGHKALVKRLLGDDEIQVDSPIVVCSYFGDLWTWAMHRHIQEAGFKIAKVFGYRKGGPVYADVYTSYGKKENLLKRGMLVLNKGEDFLVVTVDSDPDEANSSLTVTGPERLKTMVEGFADEVVRIMDERNLYRGKKIELDYKINFIDIPANTGECILEDGLKEDIIRNTLGIINRKEELKRYGIPLKRGVLLVGPPGTGKTKMIRQILHEAPEGVTCITTLPGLMENPKYLYWLYRIAEDLSPSIVTLEDLEFIATERRFMRHPALTTLLSVLDGVSAREGIITIATTNDLETIDKALSKRPARFDRVITFKEPAMKERVVLISSLCERVPLDADSQQYLAQKTAGLTPAFIQEIIYTLVIDYRFNNDGEKPVCLSFSKSELDTVILKVSSRGNKQQGMGFATTSNQKRAMIHKFYLANNLQTTDERSL